MWQEKTLYKLSLTVYHFNNIVTENAGQMLQHLICSQFTFSCTCSTKHRIYTKIYCIYFFIQMSRGGCCPVMTCMDTFCVRQVESLALMKINGQARITTLQRQEHTSGDSAALKWSAIIDLNLDSFDLSRSFQKHYIIYKDAYLKYIQES